MASEQKLHQILALDRSVRKDTERAITDSYHAVQRTALFQGLAKTYRPVDEENGERLPDDRVELQQRVWELIEDFAQALTRQWDLVATKELTNTSAKADLVLESGEMLLAGVPSVVLLYLENQMASIRAFVNHLPVLDPAEQWTYSDTVNAYQSVPRETHRTKKVETWQVVVQPTKEHPAQTVKSVEDVLAGYWTTIKFSGAIKAKDKKDLLARVDELDRALKLAREKANQEPVKDMVVAQPLLGFIFRQQ